MINYHYVTKSILIPKLSKYLNDRNCATRENMGTSYALKLVLKDIGSFKKYNEFYFLKLDIRKYFYNISHEKLKELIKDDLNEEEFKLISTIIDGTVKEYVNECINYLENRYNTKLPKYKKGFGLPIGNLSSQFLAVFYLSKLHYFIKHNLHLKIVCYMDDYIFIHESKEYLEKCLEIIRNMLEKEYELSINDKKTFIVSSRIGVSFLGYIIRVINGKTIVTLTRNAKNSIRNRIKRTKYYYINNEINFMQYFASMQNIAHGHIFVSDKKVKQIIDGSF